jgi:hypothetical protein
MLRIGKCGQERKMSEGYKVTPQGWDRHPDLRPLPKSETPIKKEEESKKEPPTRKEMKFSVKLIIAGVLVGLYSLFLRVCGSPYYRSVMDEMSGDAGRYSIGPIYVLAPFISVVLIILGIVFYFLQRK